MKGEKIILVVTLIFLTMISCDPNRVYEEYSEIPSHEWDVDFKPVFKPYITDTTAIYNIYLNLRSGSGYAYRNLYLFITTTSPSGQYVCDTIDCLLADEKGNWYGSGWGDINSLRIPYKKNIKFPEPGYYTFKIEQAMRSSHLKEIYDFGLRIEEKFSSN